jgi:hypothetical protein
MGFLFCLFSVAAETEGSPEVNMKRSERLGQSILRTAFSEVLSTRHDDKTKYG